MHTAQVITNRTCNQNCRFCKDRRPKEIPRLVASAAVRHRISEACRQGTAAQPVELVLSGGEPTLRRDLDQLIRFAKAQGAARVLLETNATLLDEARVRALQASGLDTVRVHVPAWGAETYALVTQDPGGFDRLLAGLTALSNSDLKVQVAVPVVSANVLTASRIPAQLLAACERIGLDVDEFVWSIPHLAPDDSSLADLQQAVSAIQEGADQARSLGVYSRLAPAASAPPCLFQPVQRYATLFSLSPGGHSPTGYRQVPSCSSCLVADRCPGLPSPFATASVAPIHSEGARRRLSRASSVSEQIARELFQDDVYEGKNKIRVPARIVRTNFSCNQSCKFCFVSTHLPSARQQQVERAICEVADDHGVVILSGGEPTLNPSLFDYVRLARARGARSVELQTNATRLHLPLIETHPGECARRPDRRDMTLVQALAQEHIDLLFVSLHAATADVSDEITGTPGSYALTTSGLDAAAATGTRVHVNFVFCQQNYRQFPDYIDLVAERWPKAYVVVSFVAPSSDVVPSESWLIPRYRDIAPWLQLGLERAQARGVQVKGFDSMCGIPPCVLPDGALDPNNYGLVDEAQGGGEFVRAPSCERCALRDHCFGVRRRYAAMYGLDEFQGI